MNGPDSSSAVIRIVVVDDHPVVRDGLRGMLDGQTDLQVVAEAGDGAQALSGIATTSPDVVLMDLRMPRMDGVQAITRLAQTHPGVRVLALNTYDADHDIIRAVEAGALLKDAPRDDLFRAVRATARGETVLAATITARLVGRLRGEPVATPTERGLEVLTLVARGLTNRAIGRRSAISEATVKTHLVHAFGKLGVADRTAAVTVAIERRLIQLSAP